MKRADVDLMVELTGYRPLTAIIEPGVTHLFYETLALSRRELQGELIGVLLAAHDAWPDTAVIVVSVMRRASGGSSTYPVDSLPFRNEVVTARVPNADIAEHGADARALWELCIFTRWVFRSTDDRDLRFLRYPYVGGRGGAPT